MPGDIAHRVVVGLVSLLGLVVTGSAFGADLGPVSQLPSVDGAGEAAVAVAPLDDAVTTAGATAEDATAPVVEVAGPVTGAARHIVDSVQSALPQPVRHAVASVGRATAPVPTPSQPPTASPPSPGRTPGPAYPPGPRVRAAVVPAPAGDRPGAAARHAHPRVLRSAGGAEVPSSSRQAPTASNAVAPAASPATKPRVPATWRPGSPVPALGAGAAAAVASALDHQLSLTALLALALLLAAQVTPRSPTGPPLAGFRPPAGPPG